MKEPSWWYGQGSPLGRALRPVGAVWGRMAEARHRRLTPYRSRLPVICVGNLTAGGAGKTPVALHVGETLQRLGIRFAYLSRGYGGSRRGPHWVDAAADRSSEVGDEPLLLAERAPTLVSRDRASGARTIEDRAPSFSAIVMDDGLQNPGLAKTLSLVVVDARRGIGNGWVIPAGPLRAPLPFQLALTDAIIVLGPDLSEAAEGPVAAMLRRTFEGPVLAAMTAPAGDVDWLRQRPVIAFAGIGDPGKLFDTVRRLGAELVGEMRFPDHHPFGEADARLLLDMARAANAGLVTTEKDLVRLAGSIGARAELRATARALAIRIAMSEREEARLGALIEGVLARPMRRVT